MEKDVKVEDIAQDVNKVTDDELKSVQDQVNSINQVQLQIGGLEVQKSFALQQIATLQNKLNETQKELEEKYGKVSVNLQDGTIKPVEENEPNKED